VRPGDAKFARTVPTALGRYKLRTKLATGGMAEVFLADLDGAAGFEKPVVIKRLLPDLAANPDVVAMFLEEGRIAARLSHPNVCQILDLGREGGEYFIAMEYLDGVTLEAFGRPLPARRSLRDARLWAGIGVQACEGLHAAHELTGADGQPLQLVHRDVSPQNLFLTREGVVKILDFGVAKTTRSALTKPGTLKGKSCYMSPEQIRAESIDRRSDVFALGAVLYELATGRPCFLRENEFLTFKAVLEARIEPPSEIQDSIPPALAALCLRALAPTPPERFPSARAMGEQLAKAAAGFGGAMNAPEIAAEIESSFGAELYARRQRIASGWVAELSGSPTRLHGGGIPAAARLRPPPLVVRPRVILGAAGAVVGVAGGAYLLLGGGDRAARAALGVDAAAVLPPVVAAAVAAPRAPAPPPSPPAPSAEPLSPPPERGAGPRTSVARAPQAARTPGFLTIDSNPYATIYADGVRLGTTPLLRARLAPGRRTIKAMLAGGRSQVFDMTIKPGRDAPARRLHW